MSLIKRFFTKHVPNNHAWYLIALSLTVAITITWATHASEAQTTISTPVSHKKTIMEKVVEKMEPKNGHLMQVTGFSSVECGSGWCQAHKGNRKVGDQYVAAINTAKYGSGWTKAYVPAYDRTYLLARYNDNGALATATGTDLDIWFGDDQTTALTVNTKVLVYLIK